MASANHRAIRGRVLRRLLTTFSAVARRTPLPLLRAGGILLGQLGWLVLRRDRRRALAHIAIAFPEWSERQRRATIRRMFRHLGQSLAEILWLPRLNATTLARTTTVEGAEHLVPGRGAIAITGHCGNWEWVAHVIAMMAPLTVLQRGRNEEDLNRFIAELRAGVDITTIDRGSTAVAREMVRTLRHGGLLAFLVDQNIRADSVKVPFFGRLALTPVGPAQLAIRTEVPVICIFIERRGGRQHVRIEAPIETKRGDDPTALTARITATIEAQIRRAPEQWVWMHERWKERAEREKR